MERHKAVVEEMAEKDGASPTSIIDMELDMQHDKQAAGEAFSNTYRRLQVRAALCDSVRPEKVKLGLKLVLGACLDPKLLAELYKLEPENVTSSMIEQVIQRYEKEQREEREKKRAGSTKLRVSFSRGTEEDPIPVIHPVSYTNLTLPQSELV